MIVVLYVAVREQIKFINIFRKLLFSSDEILTFIIFHIEIIEDLSLSHIGVANQQHF